MKTVKVFIASSEELRLERLEIADMIQQLNRILKPRGVEIDPLDNHEEYHRELKNCEMCLALYWTKFEDQTKGELDTAYSELCAGRNPQKLYVYFKDTEDITPELKAFKESFSTKYGHFFCRFENVDTMKLNFLLQFEDYQNKASEGWLKVYDSRVEIDGQSFVDLKNVPFAGNNPEYLQLLKQIESTQARVLKYPDDREFRQELHDLQERRKAMESSLLDTAKLITRLSSTATSARLAEAMRLFEAGDNKGANAILNLDEISHDAEANAAHIDAAREIEAESVKALESNVEEYQLKIRTLQNTMEKGWVNEVIAVYGKAVSVARDRIAPEKFAELLRNYADFLQENKQYHLVGSLYDEALSIYQGLAIQNPEAFDGYVATTLNNLALLHSDTQRFDKAEQEYDEALEIYRRLAEKAPEAFEYYVAGALSNLALLHSDTQRFNKAEQEYGEALEVYRRLAEKNPEAFDSDVAQTLNNLALLHSNTQRFDKAEQEYGEALEIYHRLAEKSSETFDSDVALTLNNLALLHSNTQCFDKAEQEYGEALEIYRRLAEISPEAFDGYVANTLNNLASLHYQTQRFDKAEREYGEALEIYRRLAEISPEAFDGYVALTLINLAVLHSNSQHKDKAIEELKEALAIYSRIANYTTIDKARIQEIKRFLKNLSNKSSRGDKRGEKAAEKRGIISIFNAFAKFLGRLFSSK
ncbi:MAG TPA: tetratricopeptide repeat protein [Candidatus Alistipes cottocaccae]|nr:tetratricopeptide repeat protein [Candidatus Alistipes cottocaccae]